MSSRYYYSCDLCSNVFSEYDSGGSCQTCDRSLCPDCYREYVGENEHQVVLIDKDECPFCNKSVVGDADLLAYALEKLNMSRENLEADWMNTDG